jgi:nucleoside-diphosphate-sugar epimerase
MKTALVMGISGGFGGAVAQALAQRGWSVRALLRDPARLPARFRGAEVVIGDAGDVDAVRRAATGADVIVYGVNPPRYDWKGTAVPMLENAARVAEEQRATVLFPGNVYVFDPAQGPVFDEGAPMQPRTGKGRMRKAMEARLEQASRRGAQVIILRMGDFIGESAPSAWLGILVKRTKTGFSVATPGPRDLVRTWAYLPDAARASAELVERRDELPAWNVFHFGGDRLSFNAITETLRAASGQPVRVKKFPWWAVRLMAPFSVLFRGLIEMRYLWYRDISLDDRKLRHALGHAVPHTPLEQALTEMGLVSNASLGDDLHQPRPL